MNYEAIRKATANFTKCAGLRVGKSRRYTRFLQPGLWDKDGRLMLRSRATGRHISDAAYTNRKGIEELARGCELCEY